MTHITMFYRKKTYSYTKRPLRLWDNLKHGIGILVILYLSIINDISIIFGGYIPYHTLSMLNLFHVDSKTDITVVEI